ncbi:MAG: MFS transporter [Nocardioides sp.]
MLTPYRRILTLPGTALFSLTGLVARLPISMVGLGIVLLVEAETDSYGLAGAVSAAHLIANAALAVPQGRLIDRLGQSRVLPPVIVIWGTSLSLLMLSVERDWPLAASYALAALAGAALPGVGGCVRARWAHVVSDPASRQTAFALEAVADEAVYITGPLLVTILATAIHPVAGLGSAVVAGVLGTMALSVQRGTQPPAHPRIATTTDRPRLPWVTLLPLTVVCACLGILFGAAEVTAVAFAEEQGSKVYAGPLLALWAAGSLLAGVISGAITWRNSPLLRLRVGAASMTLAMVPLALIDSVVVMGAVLFVAGFAIAPTLIASMTLAEQTVPPTRLTEGIAFLTTGIVAGVAPGATIAGLIIDAHGASPAFLVAVGGGVVALVAALATRVTTRPGRAADVPGGTNALA